MRQSRCSVVPPSFAPSSTRPNIQQPESTKNISKHPLEVFTHDTHSHRDVDSVYLSRSPRIWPEPERASASGVSAATSFKVLHKFSATDGNGPTSGVIVDSKGNIYGAAYSGGNLKCAEPNGCGTVFKINSAGKFSVIHQFRAGSDGKYPDSLLSMDLAGNLYGTTQEGGSAQNGTVYKISSIGKESIVFAANTTNAWIWPEGITAAANGKFYGTNLIGGDSSCPFGGDGCGEVYELNSRWTLTDLHAFTGGTDGGEPNAGVIVDAAENIYGTAHFGGEGGCYAGVGCGTIFKVDAHGAFTTLHEFQGSDGGTPGSGNLLMDKSGNLYGATTTGGSNTACTYIYGCGVVFELAPQSDGSWTYSVLYDFDGVTAGAPNGGLVMDASGNLYGTASGGIGGVIFKLSPQSGGTWAFSIFHQFLGTPSSGPSSNLAIDKAGNIYGSSGCGSGQNCYGTVFEITP